MISYRVGALIESDLLTNLNEPCKIEDTFMDQTRQDNFYLVEWERNTRYDLFGGVIISRPINII